MLVSSFRYLQCIERDVTEMPPMPVTLWLNHTSFEFKSAVDFSFTEFLGSGEWAIASNNGHQDVFYNVAISQLH